MLLVALLIVTLSQTAVRVCQAQPRGLIGHWPLKTATEDASPAGLPSAARGVEFEAGTAARPAGSARFDGQTSQVLVPWPGEIGRLGTGDFTLAVWARLNPAAVDLPGDLVTLYDATTRTGFRWGVDTRAGVTSSQANWQQLHFGIDQGTTGTWIDLGRPGQAILIFSMCVHAGQLFVGTCEAGPEESGKAFRWQDDQWIDCGIPDRANAVSALAEYRGELYAATSKYRLGGSALSESENPHRGGRIYRYVADQRWEPCGELPETEAIGGMVVYGDHLFAGSLYAPAGFFRYEGEQRWTPCGTPDGKRVESLTVYDGHLYASGYDQGAVYRYDGQDWLTSVLLEGATQTYGFAVHRGELFVSEWPRALVFRRGRNTGKWTSAGRLGEELETMPLAVYNGKLYGGTLPLAEVYRLDEEDQWTNIGRLDHTPDVKYRRVWSMAVYQGRLYAGVLPSGHVHSIELGKNVTYDHALVTEQALQRDGWQHLAAVRDGDRLHLYVDGRRVASSTPFNAADYDLTTTAPLRIGAGTTDNWYGNLSDLRIYNRALTAAELQEVAVAE